MSGFVDDEIISAHLARTAIVCRPLPSRLSVPLDGLVLSSSEDDFAGWPASAAAPVANPAPAPTASAVAAPDLVVACPLRRAKAPVLSVAHSANITESGHRWWVLGLAGAAASVLFSALVLDFSQRANLTTVTIPPQPPAQPVQAPAQPEAVPTVTSTVHP